MDYDNIPDFSDLDYSIVCYDGELELKKDEESDWGVIVKKNHDPEHFYHKTGNSMTFIDSSRISDACIEGHSEHLLALADAILSGEEYSAKRCAVSKRNGGWVYLWSPKNSSVLAAVKVEAAVKLAENIKDKIFK